MEEPPIIVKFRWTAEEVQCASRYHFRHICRPVFRYGLHFLGAVVLLGGVATTVASRGSDLWGIAFLMGGIYWFFIRPIERRWLIQHRFAKRPDKDMVVEWQISSEMLICTGSAWRSQTAWSMIRKVVWTPAGVLLYPNDSVFNWLPREGFANDADFDRLADITKRKVERVYNVA